MGSCPFHAARTRGGSVWTMTRCSRVCQDVACAARLPLLLEQQAVTAFRGGRPLAVVLHGAGRRYPSGRTAVAPMGGMGTGDEQMFMLRDVRRCTVEVSTRVEGAPMMQWDSR